MAETLDVSALAPECVAKVEETRKKKRSRRAIGYRRRWHFSFNAMLNGRIVSRDRSLNGQTYRHSPRRYGFPAHGFDRANIEQFASTASSCA